MTSTTSRLPQAEYCQGWTAEGDSPSIPLRKGTNTASNLMSNEQKEHSAYLPPRDSPANDWSAESAHCTTLAQFVQSFVWESIELRRASGWKGSISV